MDPKKSDQEIGLTFFKKNTSRRANAVAARSISLDHLHSWISLQTWQFQIKLATMDQPPTDIVCYFRVRSCHAQYCCKGNFRNLCFQSIHCMRTRWKASTVERSFYVWKWDWDRSGLRWTPLLSRGWDERSLKDCVLCERPPTELWGKSRSQGVPDVVSTLPTGLFIFSRCLNTSFFTLNAWDSYKDRKSDACAQ